MNDSTVPGCLGDHGKPTFSNGPCNECDWIEVCKKATEMNRKLKAELQENIQGDASQ